MAPTPRNGSAVIAIGLLLVTLSALSYLVATPQTVAMDTMLLHSVRGTPGPLVELAIGLSHAGDSRIILALAVLLAVALAVAGQRRTGLLVIASVGAAALASSVLKLLVDRARPDALLALVAEEEASYPSGHAALSATLYGVVAVLVARTGLRLTLRAAAVGAIAILVVLVGASRVYLGVHYPSDVVAGWLLGLIVVAAFRWLA